VGSVLTEDEAQKIAVAYSPRKFPQVVTPAASGFVAYQASQEAEGFQSSFQIDRIVAQQTGIADIERASIEERVEKEALSRLKEIQEQAYKQAYALGLEEGREKAYQETRDLLAQRLESLEGLLVSVENLKPELVGFNESHIVRLAYVMAKKIAMDEIAEKPDLILNVVRQAIQGAQSDEAITVRVSQTDLDFIEHSREKLGKDFDALKRAKFESSDSVTPGGCIVETNYGDVDATVEQRVDKLWEALASKLPKVPPSSATPKGEAE
jgi:flagellar assembly protein FliH